MFRISVDSLNNQLPLTTLMQNTINITGPICFLNEEFSGQDR